MINDMSSDLGTLSQFSMKNVTSSKVINSFYSTNSFDKDSTGSSLIIIIIVQQAPWLYYSDCTTVVLYVVESWVPQ